MAYQKTLIEHIVDSDKTGGSNGARLLTTTSGDSLAQNVPLLYDANGNVISTATRTGNTNNYATATAGGKTTDYLAAWDANDNLKEVDPSTIGGGGSWPFLQYLPGVEPTLGDWTLVDGTSGAAATTDNTYGGIVLTAPNQSGANWALLKKAAPSAPFYVEFGLMGSGMYGFGILLRNSSGGQFAAFRFELNTQNSIVRVDNWNSETSFSGVVAGNTTFGVNAPVAYMRYVDDNTDRYPMISVNGRHWTKFEAARVGRTSLATMDEVGFGLVPQITSFGGAGTFDCHVTCFHFATGTP